MSSEQIRVIGLIPTCAFCGSVIAEEKQAVSFTVHEAGRHGAGFRAHRQCLESSFAPYARHALLETLASRASQDPVT
jgi:hypothetical protein